MKRALIVGLILCCAAALEAQQATRTFPDLTTSVAGEAAAFTSYKSAVEGYLVQDGTNIADLQARVAALEAWRASLSTPVPPASLYALALSLTPDRGSPIPLNGATVTGNVYIYSAVATSIANSNPTGIVSVSYWLDNTAMTGTAFHVESNAPYDLVGGSATAANPWNSATLPNGTHTLTQKVSLTSGGTEVDTVSFTVAN